MVAAEEELSMRKVVSVEDDGREAMRMFCWALPCWFPNFVVIQALSCTFQATSFLNRNTVYVHIRSNMHAVFVFL